MTTEAQTMLELIDKLEFGSDDHETSMALRLEAADALRAASAPAAVREASDIIIAYFDAHGINDARAGAFNILDRLKDAGLYVAAITPEDAFTAAADADENKRFEAKLADHEYAKGAARSWRRSALRFQAALATAPTQSVARKDIADDIKQLRRFTYGGVGSDQARQAIDRLEAALAALPPTQPDG